MGIINNAKTETYTIQVTIYPSDIDDLGETLGYKADHKDMQKYLEDELRLTMEGMRAAAIDNRRDSMGKKSYSNDLYDD